MITFKKIMIPPFVKYPKQAALDEMDPFWIKGKGAVYEEKWERSVKKLSREKLDEYTRQYDHPDNWFLRERFLKDYLLKWKNFKGYHPKEYHPKDISDPEEYYPEELYKKRHEKAMKYIG